MTDLRHRLWQSGFMAGMFLQSLIVTYFGIANAANPALYHRQGGFFGVATFVDFASEHNTVCGPLAGMVDHSNSLYGYSAHSQKALMACGARRLATSPQTYRAEDAPVLRISVSVVGNNLTVATFLQNAHIMHVGSATK